jgi:aspartyl-tRNA(Asn)/glutamyl-tRNA(Gln) amidotransferase subunit C
MDTSIEKLAALAKLNLSEEERKSFPEQIVSILEYVEKIRELDLPPDAPQMVHAVDVVNVFRDDEPVSFSNEDTQALVDAFPEKVGRLNSVPAIFENRE